MCLDSSRWVSLLTSSSHSNSCPDTQDKDNEHKDIKERTYFCPHMCDLTTMEVRSSLSKRLMAWSRDLYIAAEILWVISRFRSIERPSSCKNNKQLHYNGQRKCIMHKLIKGKSYNPTELFQLPVRVSVWAVSHSGLMEDRGWLLHSFYTLLWSACPRGHCNTHHMWFIEKCFQGTE